MRKCVAYTVVRSTKIVLGVGRLRPVLFVHGLGGYTLVWVTGRLICILILSQAVGFAIFPHSHVHGPARDLNGSTPVVCG